MSETNESSIFRAKVFLALQFLSDFGDQISAALLAICVLDISKSTSKVGLVYFVSTIGYVVFTLVGGIIGDRLSKKKILIFADLGRGLVVLLMILALVNKSLGLIYFTSFLLSTLSSLQRPSKLTIWAQYIPSNQLERYNSLSELSLQLSTIVGPLIASFFITQSLSSMGFAIDAFSFFICAIGFAVFIPKQSLLTASTRPSERDLLSGFKTILQHKKMLGYVAYDASQMLGFAAFNATFLVLAQRDFGWSKIEFSYHLSIIAIFCATAALLGSTHAVSRISEKRKLIACACLSAVALWLILYIQVFPWSSFLFGLCNGMSILTVTITRTRVQVLAKSLFPAALSSIIAARSIIIKSSIVRHSFMLICRRQNESYRNFIFICSSDCIELFNNYSNHESIGD